MLPHGRTRIVQEVLEEGLVVGVGNPHRTDTSDHISSHQGRRLDSLQGFHVGCPAARLGKLCRLGLVEPHWVS